MLNLLFAVYKYSIKLQNSKKKNGFDILATYANSGWRFHVHWRVISYLQAFDFQ